MKKLEAVLFDLDGTLLDSAADIRQGVNRMLADLGRPALDLPTIKSFIGDGSMALCSKALKATGGLPSEDIFPFVQSFIGHYRKVKPDPQQIYPFVRENLEKLLAKGVKIGMCTNKSEAATHDLLEVLDLARYFAYVAGGDTFMVHKPNPGHILGVLDALGVSAEGAVFVGDGPNDVIASQRAGLPCIVVTHGYTQDYDSLQSSAQIDSFEKLEDAILQLGYGV